MDRFADIAGNAHIKDFFSRALAGGKVPHALLFSGEAGIGKTITARALARRLQCERPDGLEACGRCKSCLQFAGGNHPDVITVGHERPRTYGVDDIRAGLVNSMSIRPYSSPWKIYLLDVGDLMITAEAQNALLKTLEEPPAYGILMIMVRRAESLLETIRSRCVSLPLRPVPDETVRERLREETDGTADTEMVVSLARGNIGRALRLAGSEDFREIAQETLDVLRRVRGMRADEIQRVAAAWKEKKDVVGEAFEIMRLWYRDCLAVRAGAAPESLILIREQRFLEETAAACTPAEMAGIMRAIDEAETRLAGNVTFELTMEVLLLTMRGQGDRRNG